MLDECDGENLWQWSRLEIGLNSFRQLSRRHHHHQRMGHRRMLVVLNLGFWGQMKALLERSTQSTNRKLRLQLFGEIYPQPRRHPNIIGAFDVVQGYINASTQYVPYLSFFSGGAIYVDFNPFFLINGRLLYFHLKKREKTVYQYLKSGEKWEMFNTSYFTICYSIIIHFFFHILFHFHICAIFYMVYIFSLLIYINNTYKYVIYSLDLLA